jgi:TldD protein
LSEECPSHISYIRNEKLLLNSKAIYMEDLANVAIETALKAGVSFVDVRIENSSTTIIEINDGVSKQSMASRLKGAGIRAFIDGAWAFAQTTDLTPTGMRTTAESVAKMALATKEKVAETFEVDGPTFQGKSKFKVKKSFKDIPIEEKMALVKMIDDQAHDYDKRITSTRSVYGDLYTERYVANSLGTSVYTENSLPRIISAPTAKDGPNRQRFQKSLGLRGGFEVMELEEAQNIGTDAAKMVINLLSSVAAKGGTYNVVMDPILNGVMAHEAFGHAAEADHWLSHSTVLEDKVGKQVGPDYLCIVDDPTLRGMRGSYEFDWEGTKSKRRTLVKNGVFTDILHSLETSSRLEMEPNGAARSQSYMYSPLPRMSNTFMESGDWDVDELIQDTKTGMLLCSFTYGYTQSAKGQFMFQASHGYIIEDGELGQMVRDVSLAGNILEILPKVDAICKDFELDAGSCGKDGQAVPTMTGGPHARIRDVPVGGM